MPRPLRPLESSIDFRAKRGRFNTLNSIAKKLFVFGLLFLFTSTIWCASLAAPRQSLASVTGCSQESGAMEMTDCQQFLGGFSSSSNVLSQAAPRSARSKDSLKDNLGIAVGEAVIITSYGTVPLRWRESTNASPFHPDKVSIRLFNSVLNL